MAYTFAYPTNRPMHVSYDLEKVPYHRYDSVISPSYSNMQNTFQHNSYFAVT